MSMMTLMQRGEIKMNEQEAQLIEQLADQRRDEVTKLTDKDHPADTAVGEIMMVDNCEFPDMPEPFGSHKPLFPAMADPVHAQKADGGSTPHQYRLPPEATELQDLIEYRGMNFAQGNIFKAQYRSGVCTHSDELRDARKTLWFAQREVERLEKK
jgi:hypothetical protein